MIPATPLTAEEVRLIREELDGHTVEIDGEQYDPQTLQYCSGCSTPVLELEDPVQGHCAACAADARLEADNTNRERSAYLSGLL